MVLRIIERIRISRVIYYYSSSDYIIPMMEEKMEDKYTNRLIVSPATVEYE